MSEGVCDKCDVRRSEEGSIRRIVWLCTLRAIGEGKSGCVSGVEVGDVGVYNGVCVWVAVVGCGEVCVYV